MIRKSVSLIAILLALTAPVVISADKASPETVKGATTVDAAKAKALFDKGVVFIDTRNDKDWNAGRIPGAVHIDTQKAFTAEVLAKAVKKKDQEFVFYCNGTSCMRSSEASAKAVAWGYTKVYYYRLGFPDWKAAGYPVE